MQDVRMMTCTCAPRAKTHRAQGLTRIHVYMCSHMRVCTDFEIGRVALRHVHMQYGACVLPCVYPFVYACWQSVLTHTCGAQSLPNPLAVTLIRIWRQPSGGKDLAVHTRKQRVIQAGEALHAHCMYYVRYHQDRYVRDPSMQYHTACISSNQRNIETTCIFFPVNKILMPTVPTCTVSIQTMTHSYSHIQMAEQPTSQTERAAKRVRRTKAEIEKAKQEKEAERERKRLEKEEKEEKERLEKEAEKERKRLEKEEKEEKERLEKEAEKERKRLEREEKEKGKAENKAKLKQQKVGVCLPELVVLYVTLFSYARMRICVYICTQNART
jgi:hypothetical protein